jgi:hypothetical protein
MPEADTHPLTELVLTLDWEGGAPGTPVFLPPPVPPPVTPVVKPEARPFGPERRLSAMTRGLDRAQAQAIASAVAPRRSVVGGPARTTIKPLPRPVRVELPDRSRVIRPRVAVPKPTPQEVKAWLQRRQDSQVALLTRMCATHQGKLPGFTDEQSRIICGRLAR